MNKEDIIRMAREAGWEMDDSLVLEPEVIWYISQGQIERFAALVASAEREACANAMAYLVMTPTLTHGALVKLSDVVNAIQARGQA